MYACERLSSDTSLWQTGHSREISEIRKQVSDIVTFLDIFRWIVDSYVSDFFVLNHWEKLLPCWQSHLQNIPPDELAVVLDSTLHDTSKVWPLSLLCYKACIQKFSLDRKMVNVDSVDILGHLSGKKENLSRNKQDMRQQTSQHDDLEPKDDKHITETVRKDHKAEFFSGQYRELFHIYRRHVKPKKQHEIHQLAQVIRQLADCCNSEQIVDIGAGLGHLSRLLTFGLGLKVTTVEATDGHAPKAATYDKEMEREIKKKKFKLEALATEQDIPFTAKLKDMALPSHIVQWIEPSVSMDEFLRVVKSDVSEKQSQDCCRSSNLSSTDRSGPQGESGTESSGLSFVRDTDLQSVESRKRNYSDGYQGEIMLDNKSATREIIEDHNPTAQRPTCTSDSMLHEVECSDTLSHKIQCRNSVLEEKFVLCGLHACGNLTSTMLRLFVRCPQIVGLSSVGCCYMKLSCEGSAGEDIGYPLSECVRTVEHHELSFAAREMACHFVDSYIERLKENRPNLVVHSYRAALQQIILEKDPNFQKGSLKITVKKAEQMTFQRYAEIGLRKAGINSELSESQLTTAQNHVSYWRDVVVFYSLRLALAPVIETLILLDRRLYLLENGIDSILLPVFDPKISPRNFVLVAKKS